MKPPRTLGLQLAAWHPRQIHKPGLRERPLPGGVAADWGQQLEYNTDLTAKTLSNVSFGNTTSNADGDMNITAFKSTGTTPAVALTNFVINHTLTHVPIGWFMAFQNKSASFFAPPGFPFTAATKSSLGTITLQCSVASVAYTIVII